MVPDLVDGVLPPGVHTANPAEVLSAFGWTAHRRRLISGFRRGVADLRRAGCQTVWLDGSFVTAKEVPNDFDACWDTTHVAIDKLDPVLRDFRGTRQSQKAKYGGEFMPNVVEHVSGLIFVEFLQSDRSGKPKGILHIDVEEWS